MATPHVANTMRAVISKKRVSVALGAALITFVTAVSGQVALSPAASAAACSTSTPAASCTIGTSLVVTAGTLGLESSASLNWDFVQAGYDQWASGSSTSLSGCSTSSGATNCTGGTAPILLAVDPTGAGSGWAISEYLSTSDLPSGTSFYFDGAGSATIGHSQVASSDPFAGTTPGNVCDYSSTCVVATAAAACSHAGLGFTSCPTYPVDMTAGTNATTQVDLYSAAASSGEGAVCFGSGSATGVGCAGVTPSDFYNMGIHGSTAAGTYNTTVINMAITSGP